MSSVEKTLMVSGLFFGAWFFYSFIYFATHSVDFGFLFGKRPPVAAVVAGVGFAYCWTVIVAGICFLGFAFCRVSRKTDREKT